MKRLAGLLLFGFLLTGCADYGPKQNMGAILGAATGGALASEIGHGDGKLVAVAAGTFLGGVVGSEIGKSLDRTDRLYMARTQQRALEASPSGRTSSWVNPDTGHRGTVTPQPAYQRSSGEYCREYTQEITVGGRSETGYGTACRQPDGSWRIVS